MHHGAVLSEDMTKRFAATERTFAISLVLPALAVTAFVPNARAADPPLASRKMPRTARPHVPLLPPAAPLPVKPLPPSSATGTQNETPADLLARGEAYARLGDYSRALHVYEAALKTQPKNGGLLLARAETSLRRDKARAQLKDALAALKADPNDAKAKLRRAFAQYNLGEYKTALSEYNALLQANSDYVAAYLGRALVYVAEESWADAAADYRRAFLMRPDLIPVRDQPSDFRLLVEREED